MPAGETAWRVYTCRPAQTGRAAGKLSIQRNTQRNTGMQKFLIFMSEQWLLVTALAAAVAALAWLENRRSGTSLTPHALTALINREGATIIDLRDKVDFERGHIVDAVNLPFSRWQSGQQGLDEYREGSLVLVCKMGQQSAHVAKKLRNSGYDNVYRLSGGVMEWQQAQMPLIK